MISLSLVQLIERHSDELATELIAKLETSSRTSDLHKVPVEELRRRIQEILQHLSEWLITRRAPTSCSVVLRSVSAAPLKGLRFPTSAGQLL